MQKSFAYLDHAATTPLDPNVLSQMLPYMSDNYANPSAVYGMARDARVAYEAARSSVADILGAKPTEIIATSGGTEDNNLAIQGVLMKQGPGHNWITCAIEHDAVLSIIEPMRERGILAKVVPVGPMGIVEPTRIRDAIDDSTVLISIMMANNEIGTIQPISDLAKLVALIRQDRLARNITTPLYLHTDGCQAANYLDLKVARLGIDLLTLNGSKIYGPKGTGALYVRYGTELDPLLFGGGQERGRRSGTENVAGFIGFAGALINAHNTHTNESRRLSALRDEYTKKILDSVPGASLNGHPTKRLAGNINITIPGVEGEALILYLDNAGIMAATGSACSTGDLDPSHVLMAIGRTRDEAGSSLRITMGRTTDSQVMDQLLTVLPQIVERLRQIG